MRTKPFIFALLSFNLILVSVSSAEKTSGKILTISDIKKNDRSTERNDEQEEDNRSFFVKYLSIFIILAILIAAVISFLLHQKCKARSFFEFIDQNEEFTRIDADEQIRESVSNFHQEVEDIQNKEGFEFELKQIKDKDHNVVNHNEIKIEEAATEQLPKNSKSLTLVIDSETEVESEEKEFKKCYSYMALFIISFITIALQW